MARPGLIVACFFGGPLLMIAAAYLWSHQTALTWVAGLLAAVFVVPFVLGLAVTIADAVRARGPARAREAESRQRAAVAALDVDAGVRAGLVRGAPTETAS